MLSLVVVAAVVMMLVVVLHQSLSIARIVELMLLLLSLCLGRGGRRGSTVVVLRGDVRTVVAVLLMRGRTLLDALLHRRQLVSLLLVVTRYPGRTIPV